MSFVAETERTNIRERQAAGIAAAKERGVKFGRAEKEITPEFMVAYRKWQNKVITAEQQAADECNMGRSTFYRLVAKM